MTTNPLSAAIDSFMGDEMERARMPGLAVSVWQGGEVVHQRGYGYADIERDVAMTESTGVLIGSTTKALTAAAVLQLVARGVVNLDAPIRQYLSGFGDADARLAAITLRQVLTHTAGLPPSAIDDPRFLFTDYEGDDALACYVDELATSPLIWNPGSGWLYSNDGYSLAGRVIEIASGELYEQYMQAHIIEPLGLTDTAFSVGGVPGPGVATPYDYDAQGNPYPSFFARNRAAAAAGTQLTMSARDAGRWLQSLLRGGEIEGRRVLRPEDVGEMTRPMVDAPGGAYALGWSSAEVEGTQVLSHGGSTITMGSTFILIPECDLAIAVVANSGTEATATVAHGIADMLQGRSPRRRFPQIDRAYQPDRTLWPRLAGTYRATRATNSVPGPLPIVYEDMLFARTYPGDDRRRPGNIYLFPTDKGEFVLFGRGRTGGIARFSTGSAQVTATWQGVTIVKEEGT